MNRNIVLLILASSVYFTSARLQDVSDFIITSNPSSTPTGIEAIVTTSSFGCEGRVSRWRVCLANDPRVVNYRINFQVWRQRENLGSYTLVGSNVLSATITDRIIPVEVFNTYCIRFEVPQEEQISVIPEDFVGFYIAIIGHHSASTGGVLLSGDETGLIFYREGTVSLTPRESFPLENIQYIFGAPLLDAVVGAVVEGSEGAAPISTQSTPLTYTTSGLRTSPTAFTTRSQRMSPSEHIPLSSMTYTHSSVHVPINATVAVDVHGPSEDASTEESVSRVISSVKISDSQWLHFSTSTHKLNPSISVKDIGHDGSTPNGNDLESTAVYILVAVGVVIAIVSITVATTTVIFVCKYKTKNQTTKGKVTKARAASELIYNSSYESPREQAEISTNLRPNTTGYHSRWSLTHINTNSTHYSYPSAEVGASYLCNNEYSTQTHNGNGVSGTTRSGEVVSVYYSAPVKQAELTSAFLSHNEAYSSRNPSSILVSENRAYEAGNAGEVLAENTFGTNTDSVYYASPTGTSSEEFEVSSNLAYGTSPSNIRLLQ